MKPAGVLLDGKKRASLALVPIVLLITALVYSLNNQTVYNPPFLFLALNGFFTGVIPLIVAYIAFRSYQQHNSPGILLIGAGMLAFGLCSIAAPIVATLPDGTNLNITVHNCGALISAIFQVSGAILLFSGTGSSSPAGGTGKISLVYGTVALFLASLILGAVQGRMPVFFIPGTGYTLLRALVLTSAIELFILAAVLFFLSYLKKKREFLFWYALGLTLIAAGLITATFVPVPASPLSWVARSTQYLGACFILVAFIVVRKEALLQNLPLDEILSRFFGEAEEGYRTLVETATDAIVVFDAADRVIVWNRAAEQMFGYSEREAVGSSFFAFAIPDESAGVIRNNFSAPAPAGTDPVLHKSVEIEAQRKDRSRFPAGISLSRHMVAGKPVSTCIVRDLTERNLAEARVRDLSTFPERNPNPIVEIDSEGMIQYRNPTAMQIFPGLPEHAPDHPFIRGLDAVVRESTGEVTRSLLREVRVGDRWYNQLIYTLPESGRIRIYGMDITDRKHAEETLRESEERLRLAQEAGHVGIWDYDMRAGVVKWTPGLETIYGLEPGSVSNYDDFRALVHPDDIAMVEAVAARAVREHEPFEFEFRILRPGGETGWVFSRGNTVYGSNGQPVRQFGVNIDITGRKMTEEIIRGDMAALSQMHELAEKLMGSSGFQPLLQDIMDTAVAVMSADRGTLQLVEDGSLRIVAHHGHRPPFLGFFSAAEQRTSACGAALSQGGRVIVADVETSPLFAGSDSIPVFREAGVRAVVSVPLVTRSGVVLGILTVQWADRHAPDENALWRLDLLARQAADLIDHSWSERMLRRSEERFRSVLDNSHDFIYRANLRTGKYEYVSPSVRDVLGYTPDEFASLDFAATTGLIHPDDQPSVNTGLKSLEETGALEMEYRLQTRQGAYRWVSNNLSLVRDESGRPLYRGGCIRDITARKVADAALQQSEARYRQLFASMQEAVILYEVVTDRAGRGTDMRYLDANPAALKILGLQKEQLIGKTVKEVLPGTDPAILAAGIQTGLTGEPVSIAEYHSAAGRWISAQFLSPAERQVAIVGQDITERKKAEERVNEHTAELAQQNAELVSLNKENEVLLAEVHHRVKNNLTAFISLLSLEGSVEETPAGAELKKDLQNRARSMALIHETLYRTHQFSSVDMEQYLTPLIEQVVISYASPLSIRTVLEAKGVSLDLARATPAGLIVNELVTNSLKHAFPEDRIACQTGRKNPCTIEVRMKKEGGTYTLSVSDNGVGMPAGFDPLTAKSLGLKLVTFLAKHQMRAEIEVIHGKGTEFVFRFRE